MTPFERALLKGRVKVISAGRLEIVDAMTTWPWCELRRQLIERLKDETPGYSEPFPELPTDEYPDDELEFEPPSDWDPERDREFDPARLLELMPSYMLNERGEVVPATNLTEFAYFLADIDARRIGLTDIRRRADVSTVFLGIAHGMDGKQLFETMIRGGLLHDYQARANTMGEAKNNHQEAVQLARQTENWAARRGRSRRIKKWMSNLRRFSRKAHQRAPQWCLSHKMPAERAAANLQKAPAIFVENNPEYIIRLAKLKLSNPEAIRKTATTAKSHSKPANESIETKQDS